MPPNDLLTDPVELSGSRAGLPPLRLAFFGNFLSGSLGGRSACEDLAEYFVTRGCQVVRASTIRNPVGRLLDMAATATLRRQSYDLAYVDVYSGRGFIWAECVSRLLQWLHKPYALVLRGGRLPDFARANPRRVRRLLAPADSVVAPSAYLADAMRPYRENIVILPNAIDVPAYAGRVRTKLKPRLVWLRSFHSIYNPCLAVRVLAEVSRSHPEARLVMAGPDKGDGSHAAVVEEARRLGVSDRLELPGNLTKAQIPGVLQAHDIFLNTASIDNMPISLIEAMASGLCIVTTNVGGIPFLCRDRDTALLVPPDDVPQMSGACRLLLENHALASHLSQSALAEAQAYDRASILGRWETLLRTVAAGRSVPRERGKNRL